MGTPEDHFVQHLLFSEDNRYLFAFVSKYITGSSNAPFEYEMRVIDLSAL